MLPKQKYFTKSDQSNFQLVEVLVDCPGLEKPYTYGVPVNLLIKPGDIVNVPFKARVIGGIVLNYVDSFPHNIDYKKIKYVNDVITTSVFSEKYWKMLNQVAQYYHTDLVNVIKAALPPRLLGKSQRRIRLVTKIVNQEDGDLPDSSIKILNLLQKEKSKSYSVKYLQNKIKDYYKGIKVLKNRNWIEDYLEMPKNSQVKQQKLVIQLKNNNSSNLTVKQLAVLEALQLNNGSMPLSELLTWSQVSCSVVQALEKKKYLYTEYREKLRLSKQKVEKIRLAKTLTTNQSKALNVINSLQKYAEVLLHGVTGSGKTEVYMQAISTLLDKGKSALVLVPEISLTPQLMDSFQGRFGVLVSVYHSNLSDGERYDTWRQMLIEKPQIVIGTRSAVFAPLPNLGLIILDEEHDSSFKQTQIAPTYHARKVAKMRGILENCPIILGSATPSLESWVSVHYSKLPSSNSYYLSLPERVNLRPLPSIEIIDMRNELKQGNKSIFSRSLQKSLNDLKKQQHQAILFIGRRGHSTFVSCRSCGHVIKCPNCDVSLVYHYDSNSHGVLKCHYCNSSRTQPIKCPECKSPYFKFFGNGTQKVTEALNKEFPELSFLRFDSDTTRYKDSYRSLLNKFSQGKVDVLVGTQMLTKGLDVEKVTLVGVISADGLLYLSDYYASERAFQTLIQVSGRAGRGKEPGQVIIQTYVPENTVIQTVKEHNYESFVHKELIRRKELNLPPYGHLILIQLSSLNAMEVEKTAEIFYDFLAKNISLDCEILGPAPANITKLEKRYRWQILLKFKSHLQTTTSEIKAWYKICPSSVKLKIDIDPIYIS
ncbi:MAG: replication restart DNA helicase PriA [Candidatus Atelocyanobacterium thalassa isolate SIO64986]|uniref:Replication restart protein PriA n=1 Tax=Candidatus Atelocyanobacterium thalassa isolate SIO64986 TaxID=1527444 RepID=A0A086CFQ1_9CHRO|nr:MAG: replication restart DNA helicase PriA [Candidatus Atelocyanobacterium thalassa isolate SIO64986]